MSDKYRAKMKAIFERHKSEPHVSLEQYERQRRIELGQIIANRRRIYLDKRFWIFLRDVVINRRVDSDSVELLRLLRRLVQEGVAVCPVSASLFVEVMKQNDPMTRRETAKLIDELSLGAALEWEKDRLGTEIAHFIHSSHQPDACYPLQWLVWVKLPYVLGMVYPSRTPFDPETELVIQKAFLDEMWDKTLVDMLDVLDDAPAPPIDDFSTLAEKLTRESREHDHENRTFSELYRSELLGVLGFCVDKAELVLADIYQRTTGQEVRRTDNEKLELRKRLTAILVAGYENGKLLKKIPAPHVHAMCHAAIRWDKQRKFKGNDLYDFHHAAAALGYCELFLTDNPMKVILTANHVGLDKQMDCAVISDISEAVAYLRKCDAQEGPVAQ